LGDGDNDDGECRAFVNAIIRLATGLNVAYGENDYQLAFRQQGGQAISRIGGLRGDVIQVGNGVHTAIITRNLGNGSYEVVDSNFDPKRNPHRVSIHRWDLPMKAQIWRMAPVRIALRSPVAQRFVSAELAYGGAEYGMLRARATEVHSWERFTLIGDCVQSCWLRSDANGHYVSAELGYTGASEGEARARADAQLSWETFRFVGDLETGFAIQSQANNRYISTELGYSGAFQNMLRARGTATLSWEQFQMSWA
jgi:hypothetical protein